MKKIKQFVVDWVWQLPQNLLGVIYGATIKKQRYHKYTYKNTKVYKKESNGCVTLGKYIYVYKKTPYFKTTIAHEYGHVLQSRILGPLYLIVIGLPSIFWATIHKPLFPNRDYYSFFTESWANKLSSKYRNK